MAFFINTYNALIVHALVAFGAADGTLSRCASLGVASRRLHAAGVSPSCCPPATTHACRLSSLPSPAGCAGLIAFRTSSVDSASPQTTSSTACCAATAPPPPPSGPCWAARSGRGPPSRRATREPRWRCRCAAAAAAAAAALKRGPAASCATLAHSIVHPPALTLTSQPLDPRLHFALNCGAASCPPIRVYTPARLEYGLEAAASAFCAGARSPLPLPPPLPGCEELDTLRSALLLLPCCSSDVRRAPRHTPSILHAVQAR